MRQDSSSSAAAALDDGGYVIVWRDMGGLDGDGSGIFGQRFATDSTLVDGEFQVNDYMASSQVTPEIVGLPDGGFVVGWVSYGQDGYDGGIFARRFDASGQALGASEFRVNAAVDGSQLRLDMTLAGDDRLVFCWDSDAEVYIRTFDLEFLSYL